MACTVISKRKSKEPESKVVFIPNVIKDTHGLFLRNRKLFYVAMTRAKEDLTIYTQEQSKRDFMKEIEKAHHRNPIILSAINTESKNTFGILRYYQYPSIVETQTRNVIHMTLSPQGASKS